MIDYRGYGKSTGTISSESEMHDDAEAVYQQVLRLYSERDIVLYGRSTGTGFVARLAANHSPRMLILETPWRKESGIQMVIFLKPERRSTEDHPGWQILHSKK